MTKEEAKKRATILKSHHRTVRDWVNKLLRSKDEGLIYICSMGGKTSQMAAGNTHVILTLLLELLENTSEAQKISFNDLMAMLTVAHYESAVVTEAKTALEKHTKEGQDD